MLLEDRIETHNSQGKYSCILSAIFSTRSKNEAICEYSAECSYVSMSVPKRFSQLLEVLSFDCFQTVCTLWNFSM